jgi:hypothetical protein
MDEQTWFWPSMRVGVSKETLRRAKWLKGSWRASYASQSATVTRVQAAQALVRWLAAVPSEGSEPAATIEPPSDMQRPSRLLELHEHHARRCWRLGEHAALRPEDLQRLRAEAAPDGAAGDRHSSGAAKRGKRKLSAVETCVEAVGCHTRVDVIWQDGSREQDAAATLFAPAKHVDGYNEFWPQDFVVRRTEAEGDAPAAGVVLSVNHAERIAVVSWRLSAEEEKRAAEYAAAGGAEAKVEERREVVPVYDIAPHPDFGFKVGDIVLRLPVGESQTQATAGSVGGTGAERDGGLVASSVGGGEPRNPSGAQRSPGNTEGGLRGNTDGGPCGAQRAMGDTEGEDGEDGADDGPDTSPDTSLDGGRSALRWVGEVVDVGPTVAVRWMDGGHSRCAAESLYMVNTEEEEPGEEEVGSFDEGEGAIVGDMEGGGSSGWETVDSEASDSVPHAAGNQASSGPAARGQRRQASNASAAQRSQADNGMQDMSVSSDEDERNQQGPPAGRAGGDRALAARSARVRPPHPLSAMGGASGGSAPAGASSALTSGGSSEDEANYATAEELDEDITMREDGLHAGSRGTTGAATAGRGGDVAGSSGAVPMQTDAADQSDGIDGEATTASAVAVVSAASGKAKAQPAAGTQEEEEGEEDLYSYRAIASAGISQFRVVEEDEGLDVSTFHSFATASPFAAPAAGASATPAAVEGTGAGAGAGVGSAAALTGVGNGASAAAVADPAAVATSAGLQQPIYPAAFSKVAQKQWKLLASGLPQGIYVVAFASRTDLLRALIIGPSGTPYQDAVFVFDLQLSPEFPTQPPVVRNIPHGS